MDHSTHNRIVSFIWSIADDCLRDAYVRGKYRDVILPMVVIRRFDALLEPTKEQVLQRVEQLKKAGFNELPEELLKNETGYNFFNVSKWTMKSLYSTATNDKNILVANFEDYLDGFSSNVKDIIKNFKVKEQVHELAEKDRLLCVLEKFTSDYINFSPVETIDPEGRKLPPLTNHGMGYVFEELIRRFNEENNEEAGEHFTPREVIRLMTNLIIEPARESLPSVINIYDPACGTGGMLTESQKFIKNLFKDNPPYIELYGKEVNPETYAICKADMLINGENPENIKFGSTLAIDTFANMGFEIMMTNPPYGKSWKADEKYIRDGREVIDDRFLVELTDFFGNIKQEPAVPRTSDGQLLFLMDMIRKMKPVEQNDFGSRIASVHNGSALFTGDAGSGESNIRRYIIENDLLDTVIQLPQNLFYNTGITTYIWILSNNKEPQRRGKVLLIDASGQFRKLRKNLGQKNCELAPEHIERIKQAYLDFKDIEAKNEGDLAAKVFDAQDFGYCKITIERPARLKSQLTEERIEPLRFDRNLFEPMQWAYNKFGDKVYTDLESISKDLIKWCEENDFELTTKKKRALLSPKTWLKHKKIIDAAYLLLGEIGEEEFDDFNQFRDLVQKTLKDNDIKLSPSELKTLLDAVSWYDENAQKVIKRVLRFKENELDQLLEHLRCTPAQLPDFGYYPTGRKNEFIIYEPWSDLRDTENVPLKQDIYEYFVREVKPYVPDAWIDLDKTKIGYEINFNKYFYKHKPLRDLDEVTGEIMDIENEIQKLMDSLFGIDK